MSERRPRPGLAYLTISRSPLHALLAVAPLVVAHAVLTWLFRPPLSAAAAGWVLSPLTALGLDALQAALVLAALFVVIAAAWALASRDEHARRLRVSVLPAIWFEGALWGALLHLTWNGWPRLDATSRPVPATEGLGIGDVLALALGAGVYEELLFRVALFWLVLQLVRALCRVVVSRDRLEGRACGVAQVVVAVLLTSVVFALAHHLGAEDLAWQSVAFRTAAALYLTTLYALRGLGIAVCAHVSYDMFVELA